jgi:hypothetical protein
MKMPALITKKNPVIASNIATIPMAQRSDLTARGDTQSKGFRGRPNFESAMMISCNTLCGWSAVQSWPDKGNL